MTYFCVTDRCRWHTRPKHFDQYYVLESTFDKYSYRLETIKQNVAIIHLVNYVVVRRGLWSFNFASASDCFFLSFSFYSFECLFNGNPSNMLFWFGLVLFGAVRSVQLVTQELQRWDTLQAVARQIQFGKELFITVQLILQLCQRHILTTNLDTNRIHFFSHSFSGEVERLLKEYRQNQELVRKIGSHYYQIIYPVQLRHHEKMGISTREVSPAKVRNRLRKRNTYDTVCSFIFPSNCHFIP